MGQPLRFLLYLFLLLFGIVGIIPVSIATAQDVPINTVSLFIDAYSFTVNVASPEPVNLVGLQFRVALLQRTSPITIRLEEGFPILQATDGIAQPGACFIYQPNNAATSLPSACTQSRVFRIEVSRSDVFWYDSINNRVLDVAILGENARFIDTCPAASTSCSFVYEVLTASPEVQPTPVIPFILPSSGDCVLATIDYAVVNVREEATIKSAILATLDPLRFYTVIEKTQDQFASSWYRIRINSGLSGWVAGWATRLGGNCSAIPNVTDSNTTYIPALSDDGPCVLATLGRYRVNTREGPSKHAEKRTTLDPSMIYDVLGLSQTEQEGEWYLTTLGWVSGNVTRRSAACDEIVPVEENG